MNQQDYRVKELEEQLAQAERDGERFCQRIGELETILRAIEALAKPTFQETRG